MVTIQGVDFHPLFIFQPNESKKNPLFARGLELISIVEIITCHRQR
jgi:hypothetical protein